MKKLTVFLLFLLFSQSTLFAVPEAYSLNKNSPMAQQYKDTAFTERLRRAAELFRSGGFFHIINAPRIHLSSIHGAIRALLLKLGFSAKAAALLLPLAACGNRDYCGEDRSSVNPPITLNGFEDQTDANDYLDDTLLGLSYLPDEHVCGIKEIIIKNKEDLSYRKNHEVGGRFNRTTDTIILSTANPCVTVTHEVGHNVYRSLPDEDFNAFSSLHEQSGDSSANFISEYAREKGIADDFAETYEYWAINNFSDILVTVHYSNSDILKNKLLIAAKQFVTIDDNGDMYFMLSHNIRLPLEEDEKTGIFTSFDALTKFISDHYPNALFPDPFLITVGPSADNASATTVMEVYSHSNTGNSTNVFYAGEGAHTTSGFSYYGLYPYWDTENDNETNSAGLVFYVSRDSIESKDYIILKVRSENTGVIEIRLQDINSHYISFLLLDVKSEWQTYELELTTIPAVDPYFDSSNVFSISVNAGGEYNLDGIYGWPYSGDIEIAGILQGIEPMPITMDTEMNDTGNWADYIEESI